MTCSKSLCTDTTTIESYCIIDTFEKGTHHINFLQIYKFSPSWLSAFQPFRSVSSSSRLSSLGSLIHCLQQVESSSLFGEGAFQCSEFHAATRNVGLTLECVAAFLSNKLKCHIALDLIGKNLLDLSTFIVQTNATARELWYFQQ